MSALHAEYGNRVGARSFPRIDVDAVKAAISLSDIVSRRVKLKRAGRDLVGCCPFHDERTPSFGVSDLKGSYHCFGCGAHGDVIRFVQETEGLAFIDAIRWLGEGDWPAVDPIARQAATAAETAERLAKIADAKALWAASVEIGGTPAEAYLRRRGIWMAAPASIRFARTWAWKDNDTGETGPDLPALISGVQDIGGEVVGVQRIFLTEDGSKATMRAPKRSLGQLAGGALRLSPATAHIVVIEGPEDGLTIAQSLSGVAVWVACGTAMMPQMVLPNVVTTVTVAGDNDAPGRTAVEAAGAAFLASGVEVRTMFPAPAYKDFNDELRDIPSEG